MAKTRRRAREAALSALYENEVGGSPLVEALERAVSAAKLTAEQESYARRLLDGISAHRATLDADLAGYVRDYDYERLAAIDRNVLRLAAYELSHEPDVPPAVTLNEAIEIAKKFSTAESGKFVNGVLGRYLISSPKANWTPPPQVEPAELETEEEPPPTEPVVPEVIAFDSPEAAVGRKYGQWTIKAGGA